jgi:hydrogenase maturation protease
VTGPVVVGIGNPFRRDDGVGAVVAERVRRAQPPGVRVVELDGEPARLVDAWAGAPVAIVVDAMRSGAAPGTLRRAELATTGGRDDRTGVPGSVAPLRPASSHACSLGDAVDLGRAVGRLPARLVVYTVEGRDFADGPGLSDPVAAAVPDVVARVVADATAPVATTTATACALAHRREAG